MFWAVLYFNMSISYKKTLKIKKNFMKKRQIEGKRLHFDNRMK